MTIKEKIDVLRSELRNKRGQNANVNKLVGMVVLILLISVFTPVIFENLGGITTGDNGTPAWVVTTLTAIAGIGLVLLVWRTSGK